MTDQQSLLSWLLYLSSRLCIGGGSDVLWRSRSLVSRLKVPSEVQLLVDIAPSVYLAAALELRKT